MKLIEIRIGQEQKVRVLTGFNALGDQFWKTKLESFIYELERSSFLADSQESFSEIKEILELQPSNEYVKKASQWAKGAELLNWSNSNFSVNFTPDLTLVHPLTGETISLKDYIQDEESNFSIPKNLIYDHLKNLICKDENTINFKDTFLCFWRFISKIPGNSTQKLLWENLPVDPRVPDRSIWTHIYLSSALSGILSQGEDLGLLSFSISPVQPFIAQARTMSDLWAGSHLLASIALQAVKVIGQAFGPDAVILPSLQGISQFDYWLLEYFNEKDSFKKWRDYLDIGSLDIDSNPLFYASLPNRFTAIIPFSKAEEIEKEISRAINDFLYRCGNRVISTLTKSIESERVPERVLGGYWKSQMQRHLKDFPQIATAVVRWPSWEESDSNWLDSQSVNTLVSLSEKLDGTKNFFSKNNPITLWNDVLKQPIQVQKETFYSPNPGTLYTPVFYASETLRNASKAAQRFSPSSEDGYKCSICGEREWLSDLEICKVKGQQRKAVELSASDRETAKFSSKVGERDGTIWTHLHTMRPSVAKKGEHLCGRCALKRTWPDLIMEDAKKYANSNLKQKRYNISTHTMAMLGVVQKIIDPETIKKVTDGQGDQNQYEQKLLEAFVEWEKELDRLQKTDSKDPNIFNALPKKLNKDINNFTNNSQLIKKLKEIPYLIELHRELSDSKDIKLPHLLNEIGVDILKYRYYAMIKFDGDSMGTWLSSMENSRAITFLDSFHPNLKKQLEELKAQSEKISSYLSSVRPPSPSRHLLISEALTSFASLAVPYVVEEMFAGKLIYAGGDDVLAMMPLEHLMPISLLLRSIYSGTQTTNQVNDDSDQKSPELKSGWWHMDQKNLGLKMAMGSKATASAGIVVAHYSTPISYVLNLLRKAEHEAKQSGRNALSIHLLSRGGGKEPLVVHFQDPNKKETTCSIDLLSRFIDQATKFGFSTNAYYSAQDWLRDLPQSIQEEKELSPQDKEMITQVLSYRLCRQSERCEDSQEINELVGEIVQAAADGQLTSSIPKKSTGTSIARPNDTQEIKTSLVGFFATAEFLQPYRKKYEVKTNA